jgi:hypothetical protein
VRYPPTWYVTDRPLIFVTSPVQVLAVAASYPLPRSNAGADGCEPAEALQRMPADGAFIYGRGYGDAPAVRLGSAYAFPPQPRHFALRHLAQYECMGRSYMVTFSAAGQALQVLDSLRAGR